MTSLAASLEIRDAEAFVSGRLEAPDVYFEPGYGTVDAGEQRGRWVSVTALDGAWQIPICLREFSDGLDATSPYGYAGVYSEQSLSSDDQAQLWVSTQTALHDLGVVSLFLRQTPLLPESTFTPINALKVVADHRTVAVALVDAGTVWSGMQGRSRTSIRKADRLGYTTTVRSAQPSDLWSGSAFRTLYEEAMRRRHAANHYFFSDEYYQGLSGSLGERLLIAQAIDSHGEVGATALFMVNGDLMHYHLSAASVQAGRDGATNQLVWAAMRHGFELGVDRIHLGGGVSGDDPLFKFKQSFGGAVMSFNAYGVVIDPDRYRSLVEVRADQLGLDRAELSTASYFPQYRMTP